MRFTPLSIVQDCPKVRDKDRLSSDHLCQSLAELRAASEYEESKRESQQQTTMLPLTRASLRTRDKEEQELEQQVQQWATENVSQTMSAPRLKYLPMPLIRNTISVL